MIIHSKGIINLPSGRTTFKPSLEQISIEKFRKKCNPMLIPPLVKPKVMEILCKK